MTPFESFRARTAAWAGMLVVGSFYNGPFRLSVKSALAYGLRSSYDKDVYGTFCLPLEFPV